MSILNSPTDLGSYDLNKLVNPFPQNPFLIHKIQDAILELKGRDHITVAYKKEAKKDIHKLVKDLFYVAHEEDKKWRPGVIRIIGNVTMKWIEEYMENEKDPDDIPKELYKSPGLGGDRPESDCGNYV